MPQHPRSVSARGQDWRCPRQPSDEGRWKAGPGQRLTFSLTLQLDILWAYDCDQYRTTTRGLGPPHSPWRRRGHGNPTGFGQVGFLASGQLGLREGIPRSGRIGSPPGISPVGGGLRRLNGCWGAAGGDDADSRPVHRLEGARGAVGRRPRRCRKAPEALPCAPEALPCAPEALPLRGRRSLAQLESSASDAQPGPQRAPVVLH
jgi:hypothetical protein